MGPISPGKNNKNKRFLVQKNDTTSSSSNFSFVHGKNSSSISKKPRKYSNKPSITPLHSDVNILNDHDYFVNHTKVSNSNSTDSDSNEMETINEYIADSPSDRSSHIDKTDSGNSIEDLNVNSTNCTNCTSSCNQDGLNNEPLLKEANNILEGARYLEVDPAPYIIMLDSTNHSGNIGNIHPMSLGRKIVNFKVKGVQELKKVGRNRIKCIFDSAMSANNFLDSPFAKQNNLNAYLPINQVQRQGLVRNVDPSIEESEILSNLSQTFHVSSVRRLKKRVVDPNGQTSYVPIPLVVVTFKGKCLPDHVNLFFTRCPVEPYVKLPVQCYNCLRYGHTAKACRSKTRCCNCSLEHKSQNCPNSRCPCCIYCKGTHSALSRDCPQRHIEIRIGQYMAYENISYNEAKAIVSPNIVKSQVKRYSYAQSLEVNKEQFPCLSNKENTMFREKFCVQPSTHLGASVQPTLTQTQSNTHLRQSVIKSPKNRVSQHPPKFTNKYYSQFCQQTVSPSSPVYSQVFTATTNTNDTKSDNVIHNQDEMVQILNNFKYNNFPISSLIPALYKIITNTQETNQTFKINDNLNEGPEEESQI